MSTQTTRELKGLVIGVVAGLAAVGLSFGAGAIIHVAMARATSPATTAPSPAISETAPTTGFTAQMIGTGRQLFAQNCASCHGATGAGSIGPSLRNTDLPNARIISIITNGKGQMPPFRGQLSATQMNDITGFVKTLK